jgi:Protein of unknown function (DUF3037)
MPTKSVHTKESAPEAGPRFRYRILRYVPNIARGEYLNVGIVIEEIGTPRLAVRTLQESREFARIRRFHPEADEILLRNLGRDLEDQLLATDSKSRLPLDNVDETLSNALQFGPSNATVAENIADELDRLYEEYVSEPRSVSAYVVAHTRDWMRERATEVFRQYKVLEKLSQRVAVEAFTHLGDPFTFDYGYQNGVRGFIQVLPSWDDVPQAKVLAFTAERIHARDSSAKITAIVDPPPQIDKTRRHFVEKLFVAHGIEVVTIGAVEDFAKRLSRQLA